MLIDTHCHIHDHEFFSPELAEEVYRRACEQDVAMLCVGTSQPDSRVAVEFVARHDNTWAIVGVHPHEAKGGVAEIGAILAQELGVASDDKNWILNQVQSDTVKKVHGPDTKVVGIGEIGLDYYYNHSSRSAQIAALEQQLQWAHDYDLPVSFHVREAYDDFWPILDNFAGTRGVLHSFTDSIEHMQKGLDRGLYVAINGISTFTKDERQKAMFMAIPLERLLLETDAPFLTPVPFRGKVNEPGMVREVARYAAAARGLPEDELARYTTANAKQLFRLA